MLGICPRSVLIIGLLVSPLVACSGDDSPPESSVDDTSTSSTSSITPTTQPAAPDTENVRPHIEALLGHWDGAMSDILADPAAVEADPAHPLRIALAEAFTTDSPYVEDIGLLLSGYTNQDVSRITGLVQETSLTAFTESSEETPDFVSFVFCAYSEAEVTLVGGEEEPVE